MSVPFIYADMFNKNTSKIDRLPYVCLTEVAATFKIEINIYHMFLIIMKLQLLSVSLSKSSSMLPLLYKDGLLTAFISTTSMFFVISYYYYNNHNDSDNGDDATECQQQQRELAFWPNFNNITVFNSTFKLAVKEKQYLKKINFISFLFLDFVNVVLFRRCWSLGSINLPQKVSQLQKKKKKNNNNDDDEKLHENNNNKISHKNHKNI